MDPMGSGLKRTPNIGEPPTSGWKPNKGHVQKATHGALWILATGSHRARPAPYRSSSTQGRSFLGGDKWDDYPLVN